MPDPDRRPLAPLSAVLTPANTIACPACGGFLFFDWGLKVLDVAYKSVTPRFEGVGSTNNVHLCASCHHPIVAVGSDYYDADEFIARETIEKLIREGQAREHRVPVSAMDP